jgi:hypothetical protein
MDFEDELNAEDFIPNDGAEQVEEDVDLYDLLFKELSKIMMNRDSSSLEILYWLVGDKLRRVLAVISDKDKGLEALNVLQQQISTKYGHEFTLERLHECIKIADEFPDLALFSELVDHLCLEHIQALITVESDMARTYYGEMSKLEKWTPATLKEKIELQAFEKEYGDDV